MKETPIIFSAPMVQAILAGRKTQTRRETHDNGDKLIGYEYVTDAPTTPEFWKGKKAEPYTGWVAKFNNLPIMMPRMCPFGSAGDMLYVREEHYRYGKWIKDGKTKKGNQKWKFVPVRNKSMQIVGLDPDTVYYNDDPPQAYRKSRDKDNPGKSQWYKRLSRFMPKSSARIWLEIESVRAERLTDISEEDAKAEGFVCKSKDNGRTWKYGIPDKDGLPGTDDIGWPWHEWSVKPINAFRVLWERINGLDSWQPVWVWVITFRILSKTGRTPLLSPLIPMSGKEKMIKKEVYEYRSSFKRKAT